MNKIEDEQMLVELPINDCKLTFCDHINKNPEISSMREEFKREEKRSDQKEKKKKKNYHFDYYSIF